MCWREMEREIKQICQTVFDEIGLGVSEKTYQDAVFTELSLNKHLLECTHVKCLLFTESVAPISLRHNDIPCGFMRSDIVLEWKPISKKRKQESADNDETPSAFKCVIELKATTTQINSAAVMQILCYQRSYSAQWGIICNFLQKCDIVQTELTKNRDNLVFVLKDNVLGIKIGDETTKFVPKIETCTVQLSV